MLHFQISSSFCWSSNPLIRPSTTSQFFSYPSPIYKANSRITSLAILLAGQGLQSTQQPFSHSLFPAEQGLARTFVSLPNILCIEGTLSSAATDSQSFLCQIGSPKLPHRSSCQNFCCCHRESTIAGLLRSLTPHSSGQLGRLGSTRPYPKEFRREQRSRRPSQIRVGKDDSPKQTSCSFKEEDRRLRPQLRSR